MDSSTSDTNNNVEKALIEMSVESWRFSRVYVRLLSKLDAGEKLDDQRRQSMQAQLSKLAVQEEVQTYLAALRARYKVEINKSALEVKDK